jgi:hypothetical protein
VAEGATVGGNGKLWSGWEHNGWISLR